MVLLAVLPPANDEAEPCGLDVTSPKVYDDHEV